MEPITATLADFFKLPFGICRKKSVFGGTRMGSRLKLLFDN